MKQRREVKMKQRNARIAEMRACVTERFQDQTEEKTNAETENL